MASEKQRKLSYRRAQWFVKEPNQTLEPMLREILEKCPNVVETGLSRGDTGTIQIIRRRDVKDKPLLLHISSHNDGEAASTVPKDTSKPELALATAIPPENEEFLDGDSMLLVSGNDVVLCTSNMHETTIGRYLAALVFEKTKSFEDSSFDLMKIANKNIIKKLVKEGVKSVEIDVGAYLETFKMNDGASEAVIEMAKQGMSKFFGAIFLKEAQAEDFKLEENLHAMVSIRADLRNRGGGAVKAASLAAENVLDLFDGGYQIETTTGVRITPDELAVSEKAKFPAQGKTVDAAAVWEKLEAFYQRIIKDGVNEF